MTEPAHPADRPEATAFVIVGLLGLVLLAVVVGLLVLPPGVCFSLIRRGLAEGRASWVAMGGSIAAVWLAMLVATARKLLAARAPADDA
ncbi:MAG: hypothetical protein D6689_03450 [Deltaproteobacteria bacterium]|nr:MAG: hypothetical protein D6689_03450 [Deltaproteobacteria bacterium]